MIQTLAGISINENRTFIREEDIDWMAHSSQLTQRMDRKIESNSKIGLVNGLAVYGPNSGALLEIEVTVMAASDEKGSINITGIVEEESIGGGSGKSVRRKSMAKGSIENVITVLRSMGVPANQFDIHVNFPGGIPVDGPSAGIAMATGIYSAIYKIPVDHTVAMTGEISIHAGVKPIGGVIPKIKAAKLAGAKKVIIPAENMQPLLSEIKDIEIIPVSNVKEVLDQALKKELMSEQILTTLDLSKKESV
jgi:Lon-like ATP-dependent protease